MKQSLKKERTRNRLQLSVIGKKKLLSQVNITHNEVSGSKRRIGRIKLQLPKKEIIDKQTQNQFLHQIKLQNLEEGIQHKKKKVQRNAQDKDDKKIDKSWFNKLKEEEDNQIISQALQALSKFVKGWVEQNYNSPSKKNCTQSNFKHNLAQKVSFQ